MSSNRRPQSVAGARPTSLVEPYRFSELGVAPDGSRMVLLRADNPNRDGPSLNILMLEGNVISREEIRSWFVPLGFEPEDKETEELWTVLNTMRVTKPREEAVPLPPQLERVASALTELRDSLPVLIDIQKAAILSARPDAIPSAVRRRGKLLVDLDKLLTTVTSLQSDPFLAPPTRKRRTALWHRDLQFLAFLLDRSARKREVQVSLTKAEGGLGVAFLQKALARVGIHQDRQAIAKELKRAQDDDLRELVLRTPT